MPDLEYFKCENEGDLEKLKKKYQIKDSVKIVGDKDLWKEKLMTQYPENEVGCFLRMFIAWKLS